MSLSLQKLDPFQLRKIQSVEGGLGIPVSRNGANGSQQPNKMSNGTSSSAHAPTRIPGGPMLIEEPFKKLKKPCPPQQPQVRSSTPSSNGVGSRSDGGDRRHGNQGSRGLATSTSLKSLSDSSSADTSDSKVQH